MAQFDVQAAMKAGYSKDEVDNFLRQNNHLQTPGYSVPDQTFGNGFIGGLLNPFVGYAKNALGAGAEAIRSKFLGNAEGLTNTNTDQTLALTKQLQQETDPNKKQDLITKLRALSGNAEQLGNVLDKGTQTGNPFLSTQQLSSFDSGKGAGAGNVLAQLTNPNSGAIQGLKNTANVASYAVPFGEGGNLLSKALLPGAISGGLQGISQQNATPESVANSALIGGAGAGILHGILQIPGLFGKGGQILESGGNTLRNDVSKIQLEPSVYGAAREKAVQRTVDTLPGATAVQKYEQLQPKMEQLGKQIQTELSSNPKEIPIAKVEETFNSNLKDLFRTKSITQKAAKEEVQGYLSDLYAERRGIDVVHPGPGGQTPNIIPENISTEDLFQMKKDINGDFQAVQRKLNSSQPLNDREKVISAARSTLDELIAKAHPAVKEATLQQSHLYDAAESLANARNANHATSILGVPVPGQVVQGAKDLSGRALQTTGKVLQGGTGVSQALNNPELQKILGLVGSKAGAGVVVPQSPSGQANDPNSQINTNQQYNSANYQTQGSLPTGTQSNAGIVPQKLTKEQVAAAQLYLPPAIAERVKNAYEAQLGTKEQQAIEISKSKAKNALDSIEASYNSTGLAGGRIGGKLSQILSAGGRNPNLQTYESSREAIAPLIARALGNVGGLTDKEQLAAIKLLPTAQSTPEEAKQGFAKLRILLGL